MGCPVIDWASLNRIEGDAASVAVFDLRFQIIDAMKAATGTPEFRGLYQASQILSAESDRRIDDLERRNKAAEAGDLSALR